MTGTIDDHQLFDTIALFGGSQQERAAASFAVDDGLGPRVLKLQTALRLLERYHRLLAPDAKLGNAQDSHGPALVHHHLQPLCNLSEH